ncbi:MAG: hypothetical protein ABI331_06115 [Gemmatimonadaceae bacterium]
MEYAGSTQARPFRAMVPPVAGVIFAVTLAFMLLFPFVRLSLDGAGEPETLLFLTKTDFGLNIFALILFIVPIAGVFASLALKPRAALLIDALLGLIGVIMIPLTLITIGHDAGTNALLMSHVSPGVGMIFVSIMLLVVTISSGIAAFQIRH